MEPRFSVLPVLGLFPASYFEGLHPDPTPPQSLFKLGMRATGGPLRRGFVEAWYATNLEGPGGAWSLAAAWNPAGELLLGVRAERDLAGAWRFAPFADYRWEEAAVRLELRWPQARARVEARFEREGAFALRAGFTQGLASAFTAADIDLRGRLPLQRGWELRGRVFAAWAGAGAPADARYSLGGRALLRGYATDTPTRGPPRAWGWPTWSWPGGRSTARRCWKPR